MPPGAAFYFAVLGMAGARACHNHVPASAAKPPTRPPITAVANTSSQPWPPRGSNCATRCASRPSLRKLSQFAITSQPNPIPKKPARNDRPPESPRQAASMKHKGVITHQGKRSCAMKARTKISKKSSIRQKSYLDNVQAVRTRGLGSPALRRNTSSLSLPTRQVSSMSS